MQSHTQTLLINFNSFSLHEKINLKPEAKEKKILFTHTHTCVVMKCWQQNGKRQKKLPEMFNYFKMHNTRFFLILIIGCAISIQCGHKFTK